MLFAHRVTGLPGCWVPVMFNHPSAWVADRDWSAATSVPDRAAKRLSADRQNGRQLADVTGMNPLSAPAKSQVKKMVARLPALHRCPWPDWPDQMLPKRWSPSSAAV